MTNFSAVQSFSGTLVASTAQAITFGSPTTSGIPIRYAYVYVENTGSSGIIYARTDGTAATVGGDLCVAINPGTGQVIANQQPLWTQAANVIPVSTGTEGAEAPWNANTVQPYGSSYYGQLASPGTSVSVISGGTPTFTISGTG
jgi:hypothetical protein